MGTTCHEEATVTGATPEGQLLVTVERGEACHACAAKGACQALGGQTKDIVLTVDNELGAWGLGQAQGWQGDLPAVLGALAGLIVGFVVAKLVGGRMSRNRAFAPRLTAITGRAED
jgi:positive regulator of sigma E activity